MAIPVYSDVVLQTKVWTKKSWDKSLENFKTFLLIININISVAEIIIIFIYLCNTVQYTNIQGQNITMQQDRKAQVFTEVTQGRRFLCSAFSTAITVGKIDTTMLLA